MNNNCRDFSTPVGISYSIQDSSIRAEILSKEETSLVFPAKCNVFTAKCNIKFCNVHIDAFFLRIQLIEDSIEELQNFLESIYTSY